jgi:hypothetical protein
MAPYTARKFYVSFYLFRTISKAGLRGFMHESTALGSDVTYFYLNACVALGIFLCPIASRLDMTAECYFLGVKAAEA